jgi:predicted RNA-binding protein YlqC (UPF0109 family)
MSALESSESDQSMSHENDDVQTPDLDPHDDALNIGQETVLELVSYIVVNLVRYPEDVSVDIVRKQDRDVYQVRVNQEDLGKVIGKGGQTAQAMRVLLMAVSAKTDQRLGLEIVE